MKRPSREIHRFALGTAQFGGNYGIANTTGQIDPKQAKSIIDHGRSAGIETLDTGIAYGNCDEMLGASSICDGFNVVTKLPTVPIDCDSVESWIRETVQEHLAKLNVSSVYGLLLHNPGQLQTKLGDEIIEGLDLVRAEGLVKKVGLSVYSPNLLDAVYSRFNFDLIQTPLNIIDCRIVESGWLDRLFEDHVEVHARSVFLQGLLLLRKSIRPSYFGQWEPLWEKWDHWRADSRYSQVNACIDFCLAFEEISKVVIGVDSMKQFREIIDVFNSATRLDKNQLPDLSSSDERLINPGTWPEDRR